MRTLYFAIILSTIFLSCACAVLPAYTFPRDERSVGTILDDTAIRTDIKAAIMARDAQQGYAANIFSYNGHVFVLAAVDPAFRSTIQEMANKEPHVHAVTTVWFPKGTETNTTLALSVRSALVANTKLSSTQIDLEVYGNEVILLGMVRSTADVINAASTASAVDGVKSVRSYLIPSH